MLALESRTSGLVFGAAGLGIKVYAPKPGNLRPRVHLYHPLDNREIREKRDPQQETMSPARIWGPWNLMWQGMAWIRV